MNREVNVCQLQLANEAGLLSFNAYINDFSKINPYI